MTQTQMALGLLKQFQRRARREQVNTGTGRAASINRRRMINRALEMVRAAQAEAAYAEMEKQGTPIVPGEIDDESLPF